MVKIFILFLIIIGLATMYQLKTNSSRTLSFTGRCSVKKAMKSVRLGNWSAFVVVLNLFLILSIILFNL